MKSAIKVAITGAAGQISYSILFRIANGDMLGKDQPIILQLLEVEAALPALSGVVMELNDCAFPLLQGITTSSDPMVAFNDVDIAILIGSKPRSKGMERKDLLKDNGAIFTGQGKALGAVAKKDVKILVVGNPANTNALIAMKNASGLNPYNFTAMLRLDHNRALSQIAQKTNTSLAQINKVCVWGNHSSTQYPDLSNAVIDNQSIKASLDQDWIENNFIPTVQKRGAEIIAARGLSSAASAANAAIDHMRDWVLGSNGRWVSMGILSDNNPYGIADGLVFGFPVLCNNGKYEIVPNLNIDEFSRKQIDISCEELIAERAEVEHLF